VTRPTSQDLKATTDLIDLQAAQWLCALAEGDPAQKPAFVAWLKQSPRHVEAFLFASSVCKGLDAVQPAEKADIAQLVAQARSAPKQAEIIPLQTSMTKTAGGAAPASTRRPRRWQRPAAMAASAAIVGLGLLWAVPWLMPGSHTYDTAIGEQRTVRLTDGSVVYLNAHSQIRVDYSTTGRDIELTRGEAIFKVERDAGRPFRVHTEDAVVQALGTQFNIYRRRGGTTVSVLEGAVQVSPPASSRKAVEVVAAKLSAGEEAHVGARGAIVKQTEADIVRATAWRERRLVFSAERLEDIAAEFGRYSPRRIVPADAAAREKRITGTFDADDPDSLILFIRKLNEFAVETSGDEFVIRARDATN
jgi:transmembrane sensor